MAQYNFEGNIDGISERQLQYISDVIKELGYESSKVTIENVGIAGDNYVANVKRIIIEGEKGNLSIIAKIAPTIEVLRQLINAQMMFRNENIMYTEVLPKLVQLQKAESIPEEELFRYAKCYESLSEAPNEVILLEDLKSSNYTMLDRFVSLSDECVRSVLKDFAVLHSLSYVLKHKEPETFADFQEKLIDMWTMFAQTEQMKPFFENLEKDTVALMQDLDHAKLLNHKISNTLDEYMKLSKADKDSKYSIIQQGDAWTNNIMFKFEDDKLARSVMIDYQASKASNPVVDLMYMIFNCTDHETRKENYYNWIDYYHSELEKSLSNYGLKVNFIYPRDKLDADLKRYGKVMFAFSVLLASMLIRKSDDAAKMTDAMKNENGLTGFAEQADLFKVSQLDNESITRFRNRIVGLIHSFTEFGLL